MGGWKRVSRCGSAREWGTPRVRPPWAVAVAGAVLGFGPVAPLPPAVRAGACGSSMTPAQKTVGGLPHDSGEASGLASSPLHAGVAWMIRDSGHPASLHALRLGPDGTATSREIPVQGAANRDWEDVVHTVGPDGHGRLWVVESGQGGGGRAVYEIPEPDPDTATAARAVARYPYAYPDGSANTEAALAWDGDLVLVTKNFPARVYRFTEPLVAGRVNKPVFVGELSDSNGISVARPSPDHRWIATATHDTVFVYRNAAAPGTLEGFMDQEPFHVLVAAPEDNVEAGDFFPAGACDLWLLSETRNTYRLTSQ